MKFFTGVHENHVASILRLPPIRVCPNQISTCRQPDPARRRGKKTNLIKEGKKSLTKHEGTNIMDPTSSFSLAAGVVNVVDYGTRVLSTKFEIYESGTGGTWSSRPWPATWPA